MIILIPGYFLMVAIMFMIVLLATEGDYLMQLSFSFSFSSGGLIAILSLANINYFSRKEILKTRDKTYLEITKQQTYNKRETPELIPLLKKEIYKI